MAMVELHRERETKISGLPFSRLIGYTVSISLMIATNLEFFVRVLDIPGKKRGRYTPKYYVFRGFHLSTCYP